MTGCVFDGAAISAGIVFGGCEALRHWLRTCVAGSHGGSQQAAPLDGKSLRVRRYQVTLAPC